MVVYNRQDVWFDDVKINMQDGGYIPYYEISLVTVDSVYCAQPKLLLRTKYSKNIVYIVYNTKEEKEKLEDDLNYLIESVLED